MARSVPLSLTLAVAVALAGSSMKGLAKSPDISLTPLASIPASTPGSGAAEIVAYDPTTQRLFVVNNLLTAPGEPKLDVFNVANPALPSLLGTVDLSDFGQAANSVAVRGGIIAVAVEASPKTAPGAVVFLAPDLSLLKVVEVGSQPDMITFTHSGRFVLTANEGEPSTYPAGSPPFGNTLANDPEGSVSIIDISKGVAAATVRNVRFNAVALPAGVRIYGPGATQAQDIEPEYIATSHDSRTAWVTLQENNGLAVIDIPSATLTRVVSLGLKDHGLADNGFGSSNAFDASDRDPTPEDAAQVPPKLSSIDIKTHPRVHGLYEADAIASYSVGPTTYLVMANEGDARTDWPNYNEEILVGAPAYVLDPTAFPDAAALKANASLGRLRVSKASGDTDGDGDYDKIISFGGRSFSIRTTDGTLVWDSGDVIEKQIAARYPAYFNVSNNNNTFENRSPSKGPEPEGVAIGKVSGRTYAFVGLERIGGVMTFDISDPKAPVVVDYVNTRDLPAVPPTAATGDLGPEGIIFVTGDDSPTGKPLVVSANEISGTTVIYEVAPSGK